MPPMSTPLLDDFLGYLAVERGASVHTISAYGGDLRAYVAHLGSRGADPLTASRDDVTDFIRVLREKGMAPSTIERKVAAVKSFHAFLVREGLTENHPTIDVALPKVPERLPDVISIDDADRLLSQPFPDGPVGSRDRAALEVLYGCGLRVSELVSLNLADADIEGGYLRVFGKGGKERLVPVSGAAADVADVVPDVDQGPGIARTLGPQHEKAQRKQKPDEQGVGSRDRNNVAERRVKAHGDAAGENKIPQQAGGEQGEDRKKRRREREPAENLRRGEAAAGRRPGQAPLVSSDGGRSTSSRPEEPLTAGNLALTACVAGTKHRSTLSACPGASAVRTTVLKVLFLGAFRLASTARLLPECAAPCLG